MLSIVLFYQYLYSGGSIFLPSRFIVQFSPALWSHSVVRARTTASAVVVFVVVDVVVVVVVVVGSTNLDRQAAHPAGELVHLHLYYFYFFSFSIIAFNVLAICSISPMSVVPNMSSYLLFPVRFLCLGIRLLCASDFQLSFYTICMR